MANELNPDVRGFLRSAFAARGLDEGERATRTLWAEVDALATATRDNPGQRTRIVALRSEIETKLAELATTVEAPPAPMGRDHRRGRELRLPVGAPPRGRMRSHLGKFQSALPGNITPALTAG